jgi:hypothetical protein
VAWFALRHRSRVSPVACDGHRKKLKAAVANTFWQPPSDQQLAAWKGTKTLDDFPPPVTEVWDENYEQVMWFTNVGTQFVYNGFGATGFNHLLAHKEFDDMGLIGIERDEWKWKLKIMESEALKHINKPAT